jgi:hypothetical protein
MWFIFWILIVFLLFSGGGYYGHRRSYYGRPSALGGFGIMLVILWVLILWGGPHWGYYSSYW